MGTAARWEEQILRDPIIRGHVRVYNPKTGEQRKLEEITSEACLLAEGREFYFCTYWEGRSGEAARYWRVLTENT